MSSGREPQTNRLASRRIADTGPRYAKADRLVDLVLALRSSRVGLTLDDIAERFRCGVRTAQRLKNAAARLAGNELVEIRDADRRVRWRLPSASMKEITRPTARELADLRATARVLRRDGQTARAKSLEALADKLSGSLDPQTARRIEPDLEALLETEGLATRPGPRQNIEPKLVEELRDAMLTCHRVRLAYSTRRSGRATDQVVEPYGFIFGPRPYLVARTKGSNAEPKLFALSGIRRVAPTKEAFSRDPTFQIQAYADRSFGVFQEEQHDVVWRFPPPVAKAAQNWMFHPSQRFEWSPDGSLIVRFRAGGLLEMAWHVYTWGGDLEVLGPPQLVEMCRTHDVNIGER
jgi:predicted DNA-binding transcriptional regulator YafY